MPFDVRTLLDAPRETLGVEHKTWLDLADQHGRGTLAKAIIALANHGGGYVVIGIAEEDGGARRRAVPRPATIAAYSQEVIAVIVKKFVDPVFDCELQFENDPDTGVELAILNVPGGIPDIVMSKSGVPDGPIKEFRIYMRKPGPASEMPTTIPEWRALFDRCVKARQSEMLDAIRSIVTGAPSEPEGGLIDRPEVTRAFMDDCRERWQRLIETTPPNSGARMPHGYWEVGITFNGDFEKPSLIELDRRLRAAESVKHTGWPTFLYMTREPFTPSPVDGGIQAWIYEPGRDAQPAHTDFWRYTQDGQGYMIRGHGEDELERIGAGNGFDVATPSWRVGEAILQASRMAALFDGVTSIDFTVRFTGMAGRRLISVGNRNRWVREGRVIRQDSYEASASFEPDQIPAELPEVVHRLLSPLYELFGLFELPRQLVAEELVEMHKNRF